MRRKQFLVVFSIIFFSSTFLIIPNGFAKKKDEEKAESKVEQAAPQNAVPQAPPAIQPYQGEITDEMITSFLKADQKIRELRRQIGVQTQQILTAEKITPEVYVAIIQKTRGDADFLQRLREKAAEMAMQEKGGN